MYVTSSILDLPVSNDRLFDMFNDLVVSLADMSAYACMDGRAYGVQTLADSCDYELNHCVRAALINRLIDANHAVVDYLGYYPRLAHHVETVPYREKIKLRYPFLDMLHTVRQLTPVPTLAQVPVSPFLATNVALDTTDSTKSLLTIPVSYGSPTQLLYRNPSNYSLIEPLSLYNYPQRVADTWVIAFPPSITHVTVQHPQLAYVDIVSSLSNLVPVYANTTLRIQPQRVDKLDPITTRYWFYVWQLLDPMFFQEGADLRQHEYYKLVPFIAFAQETLETFSPKLVYSDNITAPNPTVKVLDPSDVVVLDERHSIVSVKPRACSPTKEPVYLQVAYTTHPRLYEHAIPHHELIRAVSHLVASELPLTVCGCEIKDGFIATAQKPYNEIRMNPITGEMISNPKLGNLYGQLVYAEILNRYRTYKHLLGV